MPADSSHFAASGRVEKLPAGPMTGPRPGPTLASAVAAPLTAVMKSSPTADRQMLRTANDKMKMKMKFIADFTTSSATRSEEHTSELQSLLRISYAVFCLKKKNNKYT